MQAVSGQRRRDTDIRAHVTGVSTRCLVVLNSKALAKYGQTTTRAQQRVWRVIDLTFPHPGSSTPSMMKTRRKSKAAAAAASQETATRENSPAPSSAFVVNIPEDVDFDALSALLPDVNLSNPAPETIVSLYRLLLGQVADTDAAQRELEDARAEIQRKDVELDQALQDRETATSELESTLEAVQKELAQVKEERDALGAYRHCAGSSCSHPARAQPPTVPSCKRSSTRCRTRRPPPRQRRRYSSNASRRPSGRSGTSLAL